MIEDAFQLPIRVLFLLLLIDVLTYFPGQQRNVFNLGALHFFMNVFSFNLK